MITAEIGGISEQVIFDSSLSCFFNALLRETRHWQFDGREHPAAFVLPLADGQSLRLPCTHFSRTGRHGLGSPCVLRTGKGADRPLAFAEAAALALESIGIGKAQAEPVLQRVLQSRHNMAEAVEHRREELDALFTAPLRFIEAEGALLVGHSVHPCPKAREHFSAADALAYAPEYGGSFPLVWIVVRGDHLRHFASAGYRHSQIVAELAAADPRLAGWLSELAEDEWLMPCHPFQWRHWQAIPALRQRIDKGEMRLLGAGDLCWRATSSLRAIYSERAPWMLKFSLNVRLTNSLRHLQPEELVRGSQLARVLESPQGKDFQARFPQLTVLPEPVAVSLLDEQGRPLPAASLVWRANPFVGAAAENTEVLATLLQDDPRDGVPRLVKRLRAEGRLDRASAQVWFERFLQVAVRPLLLAQADYGLLFGAHQQNIVLALDDGLWPARAFFRDCQGTGFSALARRVWPELSDGDGFMIDDEMTVTLFTYYLFVNATFNVISTLAMSGAATEAELLGQFRAFLLGILREGVRDDSVIRHLLFAPELKIKGNFHCALQGLNENTHADILGIYQPITNPLTGC